MLRTARVRGTTLFDVDMLVGAANREISLANTTLGMKHGAGVPWESNAAITRAMPKKVAEAYPLTTPVATMSCPRRSIVTRGRGRGGGPDSTEPSATEKNP